MFKLLTKRALIALTFVVCVSSGFGLRAGGPADKKVNRPGGSWLMECYTDNSNLFHCEDDESYCVSGNTAVCKDCGGGIVYNKVPNGDGNYWNCNGVLTLFGNRCKNSCNSYSE